MADTGKRKITRQGFGNPESAAGQGEKAGPQSSASCDRSSTFVGDLADVEYEATRKKSKIHSRSDDCSKNRDTFCYICSKYEVKSLRKEIDDELSKIYQEIFGLEIDRRTNWVPHIICNSCKKMLYRYKTDSNLKFIRYSKPTVWKKPRCEEDCYFCSNEIKGFNIKNKSKIVYTMVSSVIPPISSSSSRDDTELMNTTVPEDTEKMEVEEEPYAFESKTDDDDSDTDFFPFTEQTKKPSLTSQAELNDLVRNLGLPKDGAEYLAAYFKAKNYLKPGTKISFYRQRDLEFRKYFAKDIDSSLVFCTDVRGLINELKTNCYKPEDWRLFIDSSKQSIKAVLLHNTNVYAPVPIGHSTVMQEKYENMEVMLKKINYENHQWQICGDLKIINLLLGQQSGFTKNPCYLCLWDSRNRQNHYKKNDWPKRETFAIGVQNIIHKSLVDPSKILIPPLHLKLGFMKQYVKALDKSGKCFQYLQKKFPKISEAKIKEGVFDGPQIRALFKDKSFISKMNRLEKAAWLSFQSVAQNFLGNKKSPNYKAIVAKMIKNYANLGCLMNLKLHFLHSHLDNFPENLGHFSEEQGERFHQDLKVMETRYQGRWDENMMADFCWMLKRDIKMNDRKFKRNPLHRSFEEKRTRYSSKVEK